MAGRSFPCRSCGRLVIVGGTRDSTVSVAQGDGKAEVEHAVDSFSPHPEKIREATSHRSDLTSRRASASQTKFSDAERSPGDVVPVSVNNPEKPSSSKQLSSNRTSPSEGPQVNRKVVIAAGVCVGIAVVLGGFLIFLDESRRSIRKSGEIWEDAKQQLAEGDVQAASRLLTQYVSAWQAPERSKATALLAQIELVMSDTAILERLLSLTDEQFEQSIQSRSLPDGQITHPALLLMLADSIARKTAEATRERTKEKERRAAAESLAAAEKEQRERTAREAKEAAEREREAAAKKVVGRASRIGRYLGLNQSERENLASQIASIESSLDLADLTSRTVFQQQVGRVDACIKMTALVAVSLGATQEVVDNITSRKALSDITADNVYQQLAGHLAVYIDVMELAAVQGGAAKDKIESIRTSLGVEDTLARTIHQQVSSRIGGVASMASLLAGALGTQDEVLSQIASGVSTNELVAETVFQQMAARQSGVIHALAAAAIAQGAEKSAIDSILSAMSQDDIITDTVQQQLAARIERAFQVTTILARSIVEK
jgi:hypothetical protein